MDEEFGSFVVTDPDIVDPSIDVSGLRTQTDTSLLGNIPDFAGIQYEAFNPTRLTDLMRLYTTGLPMIDTPAAAVPPATGGGGSGDGGQGTIPTDDFNQQEFEENLIDQGVGLQIAPGQPVVPPGEVPVTNLDLAIDNDPMLGVVDVDGEGEFGGLDEGADPDRIQANEFVGLGVNEDLIDRGNPLNDPRIVSEEQGLVGGITDRGRGQIPTSADEFDVTTNQFTRPTMADVAGPGDFTGAPITVQQTVMDGQPIDPEYDIEAIPVTTGAPPNIVMAKDPEGVVDPFDGKYKMSTTITPQDTEQSVTQKIADFLGVDISKINKAAVTATLNLVAGKVLDTAIPIFTVADLIKDPFIKSPETSVDDFDTTPITTDITSDLIDEVALTGGQPETGVNPFADINTGVGEFDTTPVNTTPVDTTVTGTLGPPSEISGPQVVDRKSANERAVEELTYDQIIEYENLTNDLEGQEIQRTNNPEISLSKQEEIRNKAIDQIKEKDLDEFSDEEFMVGDTSRAAPTGGDSGADSFFDAVDKSVTGTTKPGTKTEPTYQDAIMRGQTGGGSDPSPGGKSIVCTAMYQTTGLKDWSKAMKIWYIYQKKYLTIQHQNGYHKLFKPFVKGMHKNNLIKMIGAHVAKHRTQHLKHVMFNSKPSLLGKIYNKILEPICYWVGKNG